jgi:hypothetical protein
MRRAFLALAIAALTPGLLAATGCERRDPGAATLPPSPVQAPIEPDPEITGTVLVAAQGEAFEFRGLRVTVGGVTDPWESADGAFIPLPGYRFVAIEFEAANPAGAPLAFSPPLDVVLRDSAGETYMVLLGQRGGDFLGEEIAPGQSLSGSFTFELPEGRHPATLEFRREGSRPVDVKIAAA